MHAPRHPTNFNSIFKCVSGCLHQPPPQQITTDYSNCFVHISSIGCCQKKWLKDNLLSLKDSIGYTVCDNTGDMRWLTQKLRGSQANPFIQVGESPPLMTVPLPSLYFLIFTPLPPRMPIIYTVCASVARRHTHSNTHNETSAISYRNDQHCKPNEF